jgi:hypothetical protein
LENATGILQGFVDAGEPAAIFLILPARFVVRFRLRVPSGEVPLLEGKTVIDEERRVGVLFDVVRVVEIAFQRVANQSAQESDIAARSNGHVIVRHRGGAIETRVDANELRFARSLRFHRETKSDRMIFRGIAAHDENDVGVRDIRPSVCHRPPAEGGGQTGHRGAVSETGLILVSDDTETKSKLAEQVVDLVGVGAAPDESDVVEPVHRATFVIALDESRIT